MVHRTRRAEVGMTNVRRFLGDDGALATIEYVIGAAVVLGTLVLGVSAWNNGLVTRLQQLVGWREPVRVSVRSQERIDLPFALSTSVTLSASAVARGEINR